MDVKESTIRSINDPMRIPRGNIDYDGVKKLDSGCLSSTPTNSPCDVQLNDNFNSLKLYKTSDDPIPIEFTLFNR